ncbi:hypothetical protein H4R35_005446, partial [Dimargaris xerosporica]
MADKEQDKVAVAYNAEAVPEAMTVRRPEEHVIKYFFRKLIARKSIDQILRDGEKSQMKRTLGPLDLIFVGVGCIIGG